MLQRMKKIFNLENAIYLLIIGLPLYLFRLNFLGIPTNLWEILALTAGFWWIINKKRESKMDRDRVETRYLSIGIFMIFTGLIISTILNRNYLA